MHALVIKAIPAFALGVVPVPFQIRLPVIHGSVVLTGNIKNVFGPNRFQHLIHTVELSGFRLMREVAGVNEKLRLRWKRVDFVDRGLHRTGNVRIGRLVKADVAVADLDKREVVFRWFRVGSEQFRSGYASSDRPDDTGSSPGHTLK